uniref:Uncharacterized protein n=1 Tax=Meloidogyne hapla TaxID=6305 RepID=A0A1I8BKD6_MELHA
MLMEFVKMASNMKNYEEFYGNKSKAGLVSFNAAGLVSWFFPLLVDGAIKQIGLNELRERLQLKKQKINFTSIVEEEVEDKNINYTNRALSHFQEKVHLYSLGSSALFWPEDIQTAEKSLDKIFPEIRQLFKLKYEELQVNKELFNNQKIDELLLHFIRMRNKINKAIHCGITVCPDGSEDDIIHCFKAHGAVLEGREILRDRLNGQRCEDNEINADEECNDAESEEGEENEYSSDASLEF